MKMVIGDIAEGFTSLVLRSQMENPGDKSEECQQYAFAELTMLTHAMCAVGLPACEVRMHSREPC